MLKSKAKWTFQESIENREDDLDDLDVSQTIQDMLRQRNIQTEEAAQQFLNPSLNHLQSPVDLDSIDRAVERIDLAIENNEMIVIYGDYDADGVCSTTILLKTLTELGANCDFYIPNRFTEGYGLNNEAINQLAQKGCNLIITVDNGIASFEEVDVANALGIDVIITDHHEVQGDVPNAFAIIHPGCSPLYKFKELAGVGVVFKLVEQLLGFFPEQFLDLVAIGTIADLVPLIEENRVLVYHGLNILNETENVGLQALLEMCRIQKPVDEEDVGFRIGPRLNAAGRLQSASLAVQLLISESEEEAEAIADEIEKINRERQQIVTTTVKEAKELVDPTDGVIVLYKENWHEGVLGIAASRIVNEYDRPVIMLNYDREKNEYKGSARSIPAFDLFKACMSMRDLFINFGGHSQAAGMTIAENNIEQVKKRLNEYIFQELNEDDFKQEISISLQVDVNDVTETLVHELQQLAPFGMGNPQPVMLIEDVPTDIRQIGQDKNHLKMQFEQENKVDLIGFNKGELYHYISNDTLIQAVGTFGINEWNGNRTVQLIIQDLAINEFQLFDYRGRDKWLELNTYTSYYDKYLIVSNKEETHQSVNQINFNTEQHELQEVDLLVISSIPPTLTHLEKLIEMTNPSTILVNYTVNNNTFLHSVPTRENFKWLYGYILKYKRVDMKTEIPKLMRRKRWSKEDIIFMVQVFIDLQFVTADSGVVKINKQPQQSDLTASPIYQKRINEQEIEKLLYFSSYTQLKDLFLQWLSKERVPKEDAIYGL